MDEKESRPVDDSDARYNNMTDEEYYAEMEQKVEYYKKAYPDMYTKAEEWIKMLEHSEVYKANSGATASTESTEESAKKIQAQDILKNVLFHGLGEEDLTQQEVTVLNEVIPEWRSQLSE